MRVGWHHRLHGRESEQARGDGDGQGGLPCCGPRDRNESGTTELRNRGLDSGRRGDPDYVASSSAADAGSVPFPGCLLTPAQVYWKPGDPPAPECPEKGRP